MNSIIDVIKKYGDVKENYSLKKLTSLKIGGTVRYLVYPYSFFTLDLLIVYLKNNNIEYKIFGKGTNILCGDKEFNGCIIKFDHHFINYYIEDDYLFAESGCSLISLAYECSKLGLSGLEFASGIPGTIGGSLFMNAGAYNQSMSDIVESVLVYYNRQYQWLDKNNLNFSYRQSIFFENRELIILGCKIKLKYSDPNKLIELISQRRQRRLDTQPLNKLSAGSVFRNTKDKQAWQLIDELKLRGYKVGGAMVSSKHTNFIINNKDACAEDFLSITNKIQKEVKKAYNIDLIMEVEKFNC